MIENFTAEEIEVIKRELNSERPISKGSISAPVYEGLRRMFPKYETLYPYIEVMDAFYVIADHLVKNYKVRQCRTGRVITQRGSTIERPERYGEILNRLLEVVSELHD